MVKLWYKEPVVIAVVVLVAVMIVQKVWLGEIITQEWVEWVLGLFGLATGAAALRGTVYSPNTVYERKLLVDEDQALDYPESDSER